MSKANLTCYNGCINTTYPQITNKKCVECQSPIEIVSKQTSYEYGQQNPVTTTYYACTNLVCREKTENERQARRDKSKAHLDQKEKQAKERLERRALQKKEL